MEIGTRNWVIVGGSFGILTLLIVANQYEDRPLQPRPRPVVVEEAPEIMTPSEAVPEETGELAKKDSLTGEPACRSLKRTGGSKAVEPITALFKSTDSRSTAAHCAVVLQDYAKAGLMPGILERLDELGMLERNGLMPWVDRDLLHSFLEKAQGPDLLRGLKVMRNRPSLVASGMDALARGLEDADPAIRMTAAETIKKAVAAKRLDAAQGRGLLAGRLDRETEPVLRAELNGGIEVAQGLLETETVSAQP